MPFRNKLGSDISLLYVDDEPILLEIGKIYLEKTEGLSVTTAESAKKALDLLSKGSYDAIVSDYQMPKMDGIEFLKHLRDEGNRIPFVIFTGKGREELVIEALNKGADFYLQKGGDPKTQFAELINMVKKAVQSRRAEEALENRLTNLTRPSGDSEISFEDLFDIDEIQRIQDDFSNGTGVASIITRPDGTPITKPSNFTYLCNDIIRKTEIGCRNCYKSDASIGRPNPDGPIVQICLSGGLWDAGASIVIEGHHIANWLAGQVRNEAQTEDKMLEYARIIGADEESLLEAYRKVPSMSHERFQEIAKLLFTMANQLSRTAYHNFRQACSIAEHERIEKELFEKTEELNAAYEQIAASEEELRHNYNELAKQETELRETDDKFRSLIEHSLDGILIVDFSGKILFINRSLGDIIDVEDYNSLIGTANIMNYIAPESKAEVLKDMEQVYNGTDMYLVNYKLISKSGKEVWVECIGKKIPYNDQEAMLVFIWDISQRRMTEESLRESEQKFATVFMDSPVVLTLVSVDDGTLTDVNNAFVEKTGYSHKEAVGKNPKELGIFPDENEYLTLSSIMKEKGEVNGFEIKCQASDSSVQNCRFTSRAIRMGGKRYFLAIVEDISEQKRAEEAIRFANRKLNILSSITRHDILNNIMVIKTALELAEDHTIDPEVANLLNHIGEASASIQQHIEFTREYENLGVEKPVWLDVGELIDYTENKEVLLHNNCQGIEVNADQMLEKVFSNLMNNTLRHSGATEVTASCTISDKVLKIIWEDNGIGIPDSEKERIFEKGFGKTTGFGLFLSKEILSITGITIQETGKEGEGARFEMTIPAGHFRRLQG